MAKTKELSVYVGRKISDGNFGSFEFNFGETVELEQGDDAKEEYLTLLKRVNGRANHMAQRIKDNLDDQPRRTK